MNIMATLRNTVLGVRDVGKRDYLRLVRRSKFSDFLPYRVYDEKTGAFYNVDNTIGFLWECAPLVIANGAIYKDLSRMINTGFPEDAVLQFILYAEPYIEPVIEHYKRLKVRENPLIEKTVSMAADFLLCGCKEGLPQMQGTPVRNFRLYVALKMPYDSKTNYEDIKNSLYEVLKGAYLNPQQASPEVLINQLGRLFNGEGIQYKKYDDKRTINRQIIQSETPIEIDRQRVVVGDRIFRCQTVKRMADEFDLLKTNMLIGDIWGPIGDANQIPCPFLLTVNVIFQSLTAKLHTKCNFVLQQEAVGSWAPSLRRKQEEYLIATSEIEKGTRYVRVMPILWHFANSEKESQENVARIKRIWQSQGFEPQQDRGILAMLFLAALPFGLIVKDKTADFIDRDFIADPEAVALTLPIQADFSGGGEPINLFVGRKGQIISLDLFSQSANNYNAVVIAESGSGKSFLTNSLVFNSYSAGRKIRIVDIGHSYRKLCTMLNGNYIEFDPNNSMSLNPFSNIRNLDEDIQAVSAIIAQMVYSASNERPNEIDLTLIKNAIRQVYNDYGTGGEVQKVYDLLRAPSKSIKELVELEADSESRGIGDIKTSASKLAFNLRSFTKEGEYGRWFTGQATLDIDQDDLVVLELEQLKAQPELFRVVTLQLLNYITTNLYLGNRAEPRMIIFDEAHQFFDTSKDDSTAQMLTEIIKTGYRRARKYSGSFTIITQSILDIGAFGQAGKVIMSNSAFKFYLQSQDFEKAVNEEIISPEPFCLELMKSLRSPKPKYSEIWFDTPMGMGVGRLIVDKFSYYLFTSDAQDNARIEQLRASGMDYMAAIKTLCGELEN